MRLICDMSIAFLVIGCFLFLNTFFLYFVGLNIDLKKKIVQCVFGFVYVLILISLAICAQESHWLEGKIERIKVKVWAYDSVETSIDLGAYIGLRGVNITLMAIERGLVFNEEFSWAWGTKKSMEDGSNPYARMLRCAADKGLPVPMLDLAETYETYGPLGPASPGLRLHQAGYYTELCIRTGLIAWIFTGLFRPLSVFASYYTSLFSCVCVTSGFVIYLATYSIKGIYNLEIEHRYYQKWDVDELAEFQLKFGWCFYVNLSMVFLTALVTYLLKLEAVISNQYKLAKMQLEGNQLEEFQIQERYGRKSLSNTKQRLTAVFSRNDLQKAQEQE